MHPIMAQSMSFGQSLGLALGGFQWGICAHIEQENDNATIVVHGNQNISKDSESFHTID